MLKEDNTACKNGNAAVEVGGEKQERCRTSHKLASRMTVWKMQLKEKKFFKTI